MCHTDMYHNIHITYTAHTYTHTKKDKLNKIICSYTHIDIYLYIISVYDIKVEKKSSLYKIVEEG